MKEKLKRCSRCKTFKEPESFGFDKNSKTGLTCWCKDCKSQARKALYLKSREKELSQNRKWKEKTKRVMSF